MYSISFDETTDISDIAQLTLIIRFMDNKEICESFIKFVDVRSEIQDDEKTEPILSGKKIGEVVLKNLHDLNFNARDCVGISTDGCGAMTSDVRGAVFTIQKEAISAVHTPCTNHMLNLSISRSSRIPAVKNAVVAMQKCLLFLNGSSKRKEVTSTFLQHKLIKLCETRWIERHDAVLQFLFYYSEILSILDQIAEWKDPNAAIPAQGLRACLSSCKMLFSIVCLSDVLSCTQQLSQFLQKPERDLKAAREEVEITMKKLTRRREKSEDYFQGIF